jgi:ketosteroid isomerase-like protein
MKTKAADARKAFLLGVLVAGVVSVQGTLAHDSDSQAPPAAQAASGSAEQQVRAANAELLVASRADDRQAAGRLLAPELTWINTEGRASGKEDLLATKPSPPPKVEVDQVLTFGTAAVLTGSARFDDGREVRFLQQWVNRDGPWQLLAHQVTAISRAPAGEAGTTTASTGTAGRSTMKGSPPTFRSDEEGGVWQAQSELHRAFLAGDAATYGRLTTDNFIRVAPNGVREDRSGFLQSVKQNAGRSGGNIETGDPQITVTGDTARVVMTIWGTLPGGDEIPRTRVTRVFVRQDGSWRQAAAIFTPVREP